MWGHHTGRTMYTPTTPPSRVPLSRRFRRSHVYTVRCPLSSVLLTGFLTVSRPTSQYGPQSGEIPEVPFPCFFPFPVPGTSPKPLFLLFLKGERWVSDHLNLFFGKRVHGDTGVKGLNKTKQKN